MLGGFRGVLVAAVGFQDGIEHIDKRGFLPFKSLPCVPLYRVENFNDVVESAGRIDDLIVQGFAAIQRGSDLAKILIAFSGDDVARDGSAFQLSDLPTVAACKLGYFLFKCFHVTFSYSVFKFTPAGRWHRVAFAAAVQPLKVSA